MIFFAILALQCGAGGGETPESGGAGPGSAGERLHRPRRSVPDETTQQRSDNSQAADVPACRLVTGQPSGDGTVFYTACLGSSSGDGTVFYTACLSSSAHQTTSGCYFGSSSCARLGCTNHSATPCLVRIYSSAIFRADGKRSYSAITCGDGTWSPAVNRPVSAAEPAAMQDSHTQHKILFQNLRLLVEWKITRQLLLREVRTKRAACAADCTVGRAAAWPAAPAASASPRPATRSTITSRKRSAADMDIV